jgi:hypothetical protein
MTDPFGYYNSSAPKQEVVKLTSGFVLLCDSLLINKVIDKRTYNKILKQLGHVVPRVPSSKKV